MKPELLYEEEYLYALVIGFVLAIAFIFFAERYSAAHSLKVEYIVDQNISYVERFSEADKKADIGIIMLGNSRLRHAIRAGFDPEKYLILDNGRKLAILQYAMNGAQFEDFEYMTDSILQARPDYLLIIDSILSNARSTDQVFTLFSKIVFSYLEGLVTDRAPQQRWWDERTDLMDVCYEDYTQEMMRIRIDTTKHRDAHSLNSDVNGNIETVRDFIGQAIEQDIKVIVLTLPPNTEVLEQHKVPVHVLDFSGLRYMPTHAQLLPALHNQVMWWDYVHPFGKEHYCDFVHLNEEGRPLFTKWFLDKIQELRD